MDNNIYKAPESALNEEKLVVDHEFYVVGVKKFSILFMATFGYYALYWFYKNWKCIKLKHDEDMWPIARAIFSIFFAHSLFAYVGGRLYDKLPDYKWSPNLLATTYVVFAIGGRILDRLSEKSIGSPLTDVLFVALIPATWLVLVQVQRAINISQDNPEGEFNSKLTLVNYLWCIPGVILWLLVLLGLSDMLGIISLGENY